MSCACEQGSDLFAQWPEGRFVLAVIEVQEKVRDLELFLLLIISKQ